MTHIHQKIATNYWLAKINDIPKITVTTTADKTVITKTITEEELLYFSKLSGATAIAEYTILLTIYSALLHRFGCVEGLMYTSKMGSDTVPLLLKIPSVVDQSFKMYLQTVKEEIQEVYKYSKYDTALVQGDEFSRYAACSFFYTDTAIDTALLQSTPCVMWIQKTAEGLTIQLLFDEAFIAPEMARQVVAAYQDWLLGLENYVTELTTRIPIITASDRTALLARSQVSAIPIPVTTLHGLFEDQVINAPHHTAVVYGDRTLTYDELNKKANQFAAYLMHRYEVQPQHLLGVKIARTEQLLVVLLGVLKSGAAYVPIDMQYPPQRIAYIEQDSGVQLVIDRAIVDDFEQVAAQYSTKAIPPRSLVTDVAYVIYTSGTTGNPKGVLITHRNAVAMIGWAQQTFDSTKFQRAYAATSYCFDLSIYELFYPLSVGKSIRILTDALAIPSTITEDEGILINTVPSSMRYLLDSEVSLEKVTIVNLAGEVFPVDIANRLATTNIEVRNLYGPSEDTTYSTAYRLTKDKIYTAAIPIGKPLPNTQVYVLDVHMKLVPVGVTGRLYLAGAGVSKGYLNKPSLTAAKFIDNPYREGEKMYDTGDLVYWMPDGNLAYVGRSDAQVKLRGYRIELEAIAHAIIGYSAAIKQVEVLVIDQHLVAFYTGGMSIDQEQLTAYLKEVLPSYMIPMYYESITSIPLTPNGKVDRKRLAVTYTTPSVRTAYVAPTTDTEVALVAIWKEVLGVEKIGVQDNFFELGGHSLMIGQVINQVYKRLNGSISYQDFFDTPVIQSIANTITQNTYISIPKAAVSDGYPLTPSQHRIWVLSQLEGGNKAYNMAGGVALEGVLDIAVFQRAFALVLERHEILRTCFRIDSTGMLCQYVMDMEVLNTTLNYLDVRGDTKENIDAGIIAEQSLPFALDQAPLIRATVLRATHNIQLVSLVMHHSIGDGWSIALLTKELMANYKALQKDATYTPVPLAIQYKDYAVWHQVQKDTVSYQESEAYWLTQLRGTLPVLELPSFKKRPAVQNYEGKTCTHRFEGDFLEQLYAVSKRYQTTLFMSLLAGVKGLLHAYTGQKDMIIGTPVAGREHPDIEDQVGLYLNTLAIRTQFEDAMSFEDLLLIQKAQLLASYAHQQYPFDALVAALDLKRDTSRSALFDVMVVLQNQEQLQLANSNADMPKGIQIREYPLARTTAQLDLSFTFLEKESSLVLEIEYNTSIYDQGWITTLFSHFEQWMRQAIAQPKKSIAGIRYITDQEVNTLLTVFNTPISTVVTHQDMVSIFEAQVARAPQEVAVVHTTTSMTYDVLNKRANQLAHYLRDKYQLQPDDLIAIKLPKNEAVLSTIFGILKAGAAYVPIDIQYPADRIAYIEKDSHARLCIDTAFLAQFEKERSAYSEANVVHEGTLADRLAYVIYTSGTTGTPKGVMVTHRNVVSIHEAWKTAFEFDAFQINLLQLASVSFDVFVGDICRSLLNGGTMVLPTDDSKLDPAALYALMQQYKISIFEGTPGLLIPLLEYIQANRLPHDFLKRIIFGSDSFGNDVFIKIKRQFEVGDTRVLNTYGVTETTIDATYYDGCDTEMQGTTPIGKPFSNTSIYILNSEKQLVPVGVYGELHIGGAGVSKGYYQRTTLTEQKFITIDAADSKVYATGDIARWLPDGTIAFLGRTDHQVKIRGYRIELGEIENVLNQYSDQLQQAVVAVQQIQEEKTLVAYYVAATMIDKAALKAYVATQVPAYMVPVYFVQLTAMPLTPNGKIDKAALPSVAQSDTIKELYIAPQTDTEKQLLSIWQEILEDDVIGVTDDFFALGGHSLKITRLSNEMTKVFGKKLSFNDLFLHTTIAAQAALLEATAVAGFQPIEKVADQEYYPVSSAQQRLWVLSQFQGSSVAYNMPGVFELKGAINIHYLQQAFDTLIARHEILRTRFVQQPSGAVVQQVLSAADQAFALQTPTAGMVMDTQAIQGYVQQELQHRFELQNECLLRASILPVAKDTYTLVVVLHHIISDGWSVALFTQELFASYASYIQQIPQELKPLEIQYKDYAVWEQAQLHTPLYTAALAYWKERFAGSIPVLDLPYKQSRPRQRTYAGKQHTITFSDTTYQAFKAFCVEQEGTLFMGVLTVVKVLLHRYTNQEDISIGTPIAGRTHIQLQNQLGVYINTLALRTQFSGTDDLMAVLQKVKETTKGALMHQSYPFDHLVDALQIPRDVGRNPLFDVMVTLQDTAEETKAYQTIDGLAIREVSLLEEVTSKFDLDFVFEEREGTLALHLVYNTDLFASDFIQTLCAQCMLLMDQSITHAVRPIHQLDLFTPQQTEAILALGTGSQQSLEDTATFLDAIAHWEQTTPMAIAVRDSKRQYTYAELGQQSDQIAAYIDTAVAATATTIGVVLNRSVDTIAILLGIIKSGKAYIPLDPTFPMERLRYIVTHSQTTTLICDPAYAYFDSESVHTITTDQLLQESAKLTVDHYSFAPMATDTAYIIYTSGSTGAPKGVEVGHRSLLNFLRSIRTTMRMQPTDTLYAVTTYSFDISILEFFVPLVSGASVFIASNETLGVTQEVIDEIATVQPTMIQATPSFFQLLYNAGWQGSSSSTILCGGDTLSEALADRLLTSCHALWNMYGPTETTIWSSVKQITSAAEAISIGRALDNTTLLVLGTHKELLPRGAQGVLHIAGAGLAKGYYRDQAMTATKFIPNPYGKGLMYDTGDVVQWGTNGELLFLGRNDHQVKIRGYRIELGDIEAQLHLLPTIEQAVVIAKKDGVGASFLVAFYTAPTRIEVAALKQHLKAVVPAYMIPSAFVHITDFPLTPNKKVDRKTLAAMDAQMDVTETYIEPVTPIEKEIAQLWSELLGIQKISKDAQFFELGGHSLTATKLVSSIQEAFGVQLTLDKLFEHTTIEDQAALVENTQLIHKITHKETTENTFESFTV